MQALFGGKMMKAQFVCICYPMLFVSHSFVSKRIPPYTIIFQELYPSKSRNTFFILGRYIVLHTYLLWQTTGYAQNLSQSQQNVTCSLNLTSDRGTRPARTFSLAQRRLVGCRRTGDGTSDVARCWVCCLRGAGAVRSRSFFFGREIRTEYSTF